MVIQHNLESLNTAGIYKKTTNLRSNSSKRLSSGYRINSAADDAAGLAVSQKMRMQIRGLDRATKNIGEGIDLIRVGDGGMKEIQAMLQRMRELSVAAANDVNTVLERDSIQKEINALTAQINCVANDTNYNGIYMLNGTSTSAPPTPGGGTGPVVDDTLADALAGKGTFGGSGDDTLGDVIFESDSVVFCGNTKSSDQDLDGTAPSDGKRDGWVTKVDSSGDVVWSTKVGAGNLKDESFSSITKTQDGGYLAGGVQDGKVYMAKLDADGNVEWDYAFRSSGTQSSINGVELMQDGSGNVFISIQTYDGNGIVDGNGNPLGGNSLGGRDSIIMVIDPTKDPNTDYGNFEVKSYRVGGSSNEQISKIYPTSDGGYIGGNYTTSGTINQSSASGTSTPPQTTIGNGHHHSYIVKFDGAGDVEKVLKFGDDNTPGMVDNSGENINQIIETKDGGYIVVGNADITDTVGDATPTPDHSRGKNIWFMKLDRDLNPEWSRSYGSSADDVGTSIVETENGYVVAGRVGAINGDVTPKDGYSGESAWIFMVDKAGGDIIWDEIHGGSQQDGFSDMFQMANGDILVAGNSKSNNADLDGKNKGGQDAWFLTISGTTGESSGGSAGSGGTVVRPAGGGDILLQIGAEAFQSFAIERADMRATTLFGDPIDLDMSSHETAGEAMTKFDKAIEYVSAMRGKYGAYENTLTAQSSLNEITSENTSSAESKITDADMALEMINFSKANILSQVGEAMMAQNNASKENVLKLLQ